MRGRTVDVQLLGYPRRLSAQASSTAALGGTGMNDVVERDRRIATIAEQSRNLTVALLQRLIDPRSRSQSIGFPKKHIVMHNYCLRFFASFALTSEEPVRAVGQVVSTYSRRTTAG
jgi:hypothetical protein